MIKELTIKLTGEDSLTQWIKLHKVIEVAIEEYGEIKITFKK